MNISPALPLISRFCCSQGFSNDKASFTGRQEDFYVSTRKNHEWNPAKNIGPPINTYYNEGAPTLSVDGNVLIFTACESVNGYGANRSGFGRCDLFISGKTGITGQLPEPWHSSKLKILGISAILSADGRTLFFVSNRDDELRYLFYRSG
ncbi:MAG: hypothetical protein R2759_19890 [Bacteroidales bacterium]